MSKFCNFLVKYMSPIVTLYIIGATVTLGLIGRHMRLNGAGDSFIVPLIIFTPMIAISAALLFHLSSYLKKDKESRKQWADNFHKERDCCNTIKEKGNNWFYSVEPIKEEETMKSEKNRELIRIKTEDGLSIDAEVTKKTTKVLSEVVSNEVRDFKVGDYVITKNDVFIKIVRKFNKDDYALALKPFNYFDEPLRKGYIARHATSDEIALHTRYTEKELELRDQMAMRAIMGKVSDKVFGNRQEESNINFAQDAYHLAEAMLEARKKVQSNE